jgi:ADP-ribose pyrophosphatase YjhB (NUDIX family)
VSRTIISFLIGDMRFNYRTAAIIAREGHVLACREDDDPYLLLPGGRVELGERSDIALGRELSEELGHEAVVGELAFSVENFFERDGVRFHEIGRYYRAALDPAFPFRSDGRVVLTRPDEGHVLSFIWLPAQDEALAAANLLPNWLRRELILSATGPARHLIRDERRDG